VLTYHVVPGKLLAKDLKAGPLTSVEGASIAVKVGSQGVMVNNATVATADVKASNGVIHAIDKVILPERPSAAKPAPSKAAPATGLAPAMPAVVKPMAPVAPVAPVAPLAPITK
jgi:Fasciclin domain